jgi:hypothetical protein
MPIDAKMINKVAVQTLAVTNKARTPKAAKSLIPPKAEKGDKVGKVTRGFVALCVNQNDAVIQERKDAAAARQTNAGMKATLATLEARLAALRAKMAKKVAKKGKRVAKKG